MTVRAIAVFSGQTDFWWQRCLKPGFRHCGVMVEAGGHWIVLEPLAARLEVRVLAPAQPAALIRMLRRRNLLAIEAEVMDQAVPVALPGLFTCVAAVKRVLGIRAFWVQTPWQLYKKLHYRKKYLDMRR